LAERHTQSGVQDVNLRGMTLKVFPDSLP